MVLAICLRHAAEPSHLRKRRARARKRGGVQAHAARQMMAQQETTNKAVDALHKMAEAVNTALNRRCDILRSSLLTLYTGSKTGKARATSASTFCGRLRRRCYLCWSCRRTKQRAIGSYCWTWDQAAGRTLGMLLPATGPEIVNSLRPGRFGVFHVHGSCLPFVTWLKLNTATQLLPLCRRVSKANGTATG